ncbi:MAG: hypothetical protein MZV64_30960 [Ignavibacteriales bacterium]|nr:hypothetical protein [Ignavibacteriales bacterium]
MAEKEKPHATGKPTKQLLNSLKNLENDETLLVQSGKPVGIFKTHTNAPRVIISNSMLVPDWATWDEFRRLEAAWFNYVWTDDSRQLDLYRHSRNIARHL